MGCSRGKPNIYQKNYFHTKIDLCEELKIEKWVKKLKKKQIKILIFLYQTPLFLIGILIHWRKIFLLFNR